MTEGNDSSDAGDERRAFLQRRVAAFGFVATVVGLLGFVLRPILILIAGRTELLVDRAVLFNLLAFAPLTCAWLYLRRGRRSRRIIVAVEQGALLLSALGFVGLANSIPVEIAPEVVIPFGFGLVLILRAVFVPSPARRTFLTALAAAPLILGATFLVYSRTDPPVLEVDFGTGYTDAYMKTSMTFVWWVFVTLVTTVTSRVIYGLRQEIRDIRKLGQYTLEAKLGEGGMGAVYRASHAMLRRPAAIKLLSRGRAGDDSLARFEREVQLTARLTHANTVTVFDYGRTPSGVFYYVMELLAGVNLLDVVEIDGPQPPGRVVHLLRQAASSLSEAHGIGLIHRDVKPANIMLCKQGGVPDTVKLVDFGLVKDLDNNVSTSLTNAGAIQGTPQYMAPEAIRDPRGVTAATDLYSLGAVGYFLLTGTHVFAGNAVEVCSHHLHTAPEPPSARLGSPLPAELERVILDCMAKDPADRPASADALHERLEAVPVARWTTADARAWWDQHADAIARAHAAADDTGNATLEIDLATFAR